MTLITANANWKRSLQIQNRNFQFIVLLKNEFNILSSIKSINDRYMYNINLPGFVLTEWYHWFPFIIHYIVNIKKLIWHNCREVILYVLYLRVIYKPIFIFTLVTRRTLSVYCIAFSMESGGKCNVHTHWTTSCISISRFFMCILYECQLTNCIQFYWWQYSYTGWAKQCYSY